MKLIKNDLYLLLIDEEAEIKKGDYILEKELIINIFPNYLTDLDECSKIIAYYPLTKEAKELDLPLLPNPFKVNVPDIEYEDWMFGYTDKEVVIAQNAFKEGYKAAQYDKQFSLEDMKKALSEAFKASQEGYQITADEIIQSLSTQQLPVSFEPEFVQTKLYIKKEDLMMYEAQPKEFQNPHTTNPNDIWELKTITNSEGKQELVGTYKH